MDLSFTGIILKKTPFQCQEIIENWKYIFMFPEINSAQQGLTHCGLVMPYSNIDLDQELITSAQVTPGNGLLPDGTQPLPQLIWTYKRCSVAFTISVHEQGHELNHVFGDDISNVITTISMS